MPPQPRPKFTTDDWTDDDEFSDMPSLELMSKTSPPAPSFSSSFSSSSAPIFKSADTKAKTRKGASPPSTASASTVYPDPSDETDSDSDVSPLTSSSPTTSTSASPSKTTKPAAVYESPFSTGQGESKLFDWDFGGNGNGSGKEKGKVEEAYEVLRWKKGWGDEGIGRRVEEIMATERSSFRSGKITSTRLGAVLLILCSRAPPQSLTSPGSSTSRTLPRLSRLLYLSEAQLYLAPLHLPLPPGASNPSDLDLQVDASALDQLESERQAHKTTNDWLTAALVAQDKATSQATALRDKAEKVQGEVRGFKAEVARLKSEKEEVKVRCREGWGEKERIEGELAKEREEARRFRREMSDAKDEVERLRRAARTTPLPTVSSIPSSISPDKKDFVIARLSKLVQELNRNLKDKNDEIVKLMLEMSEMAGGG
ncbi:hypothetical protein JCM11641_002776 [Rhodosporidiobolus odoratus]